MSGQAAYIGWVCGWGIGTISSLLWKFSILVTWMSGYQDNPFTVITTYDVIGGKDEALTSCLEFF